MDETNDLNDRENLNDALDVSFDQRGIAGTRIVCHHFATAAIADPQALATFERGPEAITSYFDKQGLQPIESEYQRFIKAPAHEKSLVSEDRFGAWLRHQTQNMTEQRTGAIVNTPDHTVAVIAEKARGEPNPSFDLTFYDPDRTRTPRVLKDQSPDQIGQLRFLDCFPEVRKHPVASIDNAMTVTAISPGIARGNSCEFVNFDQPTERELDHCLSTSLYAAMQYNVHDALTPLAQRIREHPHIAAEATDEKNRNDLIEDRASDFLDVGTHIHPRYKCSALAAAERNGTTEVIAKAPELFTELGLSSPVACRHLSGEYRGRSALDDAARRGNLPMAETITGAIVDLDRRYKEKDQAAGMAEHEQGIGTDSVLDLLNGNSLGVDPDLEEELEQEMDEGLEEGPQEEFEEELEEELDEQPEHDSDLESEHEQQVANLRRGVHQEDGVTPPLHLAACNGHTGMYPIMAKTLTQLDLTPQQRAEVLAAADGQGRPALWRAVAKNQLESYEALGKAAQHVGLDQNQQLDLLLAKDPSTGLAAHQLGMVLGNAEPSRQLAKTMQDLNFPPDRVRQALLSPAQDGRNTSSLCEHDPELKKQFDRILARSQAVAPATPQQRAVGPGESSRRTPSPTSSEERPASKKIKMR